MSPLAAADQSAVDAVTALFDVAAPDRLGRAPDQFDRGFFFVMRVRNAGMWTVDLRRPIPSVRRGGANHADVEIETTAGVVERLVSRPEDVFAEYYRGTWTVKGDFLLALQVAEVVSAMAGRADDSPIDAGLASLVAPEAAASFLERHWPHTPLVVHGSLARFRWLTDRLRVTSTENLLDAWKGRVTVFPKTSADEFDAPSVPAADARALWREGFALVFVGVEQHVPSLATVIRRVRRDLGLPLFTQGRAIAYATPPGAGASPHFDDDTNFVIQLSGEKTWRIAANTSVSCPTARFVIGGPSPWDELTRQLDRPLPDALPEPNQVIALRPGSLLYLPRGHWHTTEATAPALSLNFTFEQPCWATLVTDAVRRKLLDRKRWRELILDVDDVDPQTSQRARDAIESLLGHLADEVRAITVEDVVAAARIRSSRAVRAASRVKPPATHDWVRLLTGRG